MALQTSLYQISYFVIANVIYKFLTEYPLNALSQSRLVAVESKTKNTGEQALCIPRTLQ